jgi:TonB family protein
MVILTPISDVTRQRWPRMRPQEVLKRPRSRSGRLGPKVSALFAVALSCLFAEALSAQQSAQPQPDAVPPAATAPSRPASVSLGAASWRQSLVARLVRFQRYPPRARGAEGVVSLAFSIDRHGNVASSQIVKSSGSAVLDAEALDLVKRAAPLPAPPSEISDSDLSVIVPIRFATGGRP